MIIQLQRKIARPHRLQENDSAKCDPKGSCWKSNVSPFVRKRCCPSNVTAMRLVLKQPMLCYSELAPRLHSSAYVISMRQSTPFLSLSTPARYFSLAAPKDKPLYLPFIRYKSVTASVYKASKDLRGSMSFFFILFSYHITDFLHFAHSHYNTHNFKT